MRTLLRSTIAFAVLLGTYEVGLSQLLGTADTFAVLGGSTVTNTGPTVLSGDLGLWPGTSVTGFPPGIITNGNLHINDGVAMLAQSDALAAYGTIAGEAPTQNLTGQNLGGLTLTAGVYKFSTSAFITGELILDAQGDQNARFDFQIGSTLITASNARVRVINGGACNVFWQVGSSATLGTGTDFTGHILALSSVTMTTDATISHGSAIALNGAVTLDTNNIAICAVPEPTTFALLGLGLVTLYRKRRRS